MILKFTAVEKLIFSHPYAKSLNLPGAYTVRTFNLIFRSSVTLSPQHVPVKLPQPFNQPPVNPSIAGIRRLLFLALVRAQPEERQGPAAGLLRHGRDVPLLVVPGARQVPVGGHRRRHEARPRLRAVHGRRHEDDHDWWRVSRSRATDNTNHIINAHQLNEDVCGCLPHKLNRAHSPISKLFRSCELITVL